MTLAAGREFMDGTEGSYGYVKLGYQREFFDIGSTAFSVDYYFGSDIAAVDSNSDSIGLAAVQNIDDYNLQLWALWRGHSYDDDAGEYDDGQAVFGWRTLQVLMRPFAAIDGYLRSYGNLHS